MSFCVLGSLKDLMAKWQLSLFRKNMQGFLFISVAWVVAGSSSSTTNVLFLENLNMQQRSKTKTKQTNSRTRNEEVAQSHNHSTVYKGIQSGHESQVQGFSGRVGDGGGIWTPLERASWWLRGWSVCLQCKRPGFNPSVRKIPWKRKW